MTPMTIAIVVLVALAGALLFGGYRYLKRRSRKAKAPVFLFSDGNHSAAQQQAPTVDVGTLPTRRSSERRSSGPASSPAPRRESEPAWDERPTQRTTITPEVRAAAVGSSPPRASASSTDGDRGSANGNRASRVTHEPPPDGTLQLLPGSMKIERGDGAGEVIRFIRVPGEEVAITFGRDQGPPHRHVQLHSPTVSRVHARLTFRDGSWTLRNESATNPTVVNGRPLEGRPAEAPLRDGDRVEMGDITFVFQQSEPSNRLAVRSSWYTDRGRRATNQDAVAARTLSDGRELAVVCDGMGSHAAGGMASHVALEALVNALTEGQSLVRGVKEANRAVRRRAETDVLLDGMGTTLVALLREGDRYEVANVGDSRAYRIDREGIRQLTRDHSFVTEAVEEGGMSMEEATRSPWRNAVTRSLGSEPDVDVDVFGPFDATVSHTAVLSSDGVHGVLSEEEIERVVQSTSDVRDLARALAEAALGKGSDDNVAVVAVDFSP